MRWNRLLPALLCLLTLCGCAGSDRGREPENTVLAQVVGIDRPEGTWLVTAAGKDGKGETVYRTAEGKTLGEAFGAIPGAGESWMSVSGVSDFLVGDGVELREALFFVLDDSGMSWRANVWCVPIAVAVMEEHTAGGGDRLTVLKESGIKTVTVLDALADLEETGRTQVLALTTQRGKLTVGGTLYYERREGDG